MKIRLSSAIDWLIRIYTILTIVWVILSYCNLIPYYQVRLYKTSSVVPRINFFPGQQIRLDLNFPDGIFKEDIKAVKWRILKDSKYLYETDGLSPTIKLPTTVGGIYQLAVIAHTSDGLSKEGTLNFYVVQDKIQTIKFSKVKLTPQNTNEVLLKNLKKNGAEVYVGDNQWENAKSVVPSDQGIILEIKSNTNIPSFNNQIFIRMKGSIHQLENYDFIRIPDQECHIQN